MSWQSDDGEHEGWAQRLLPDGQVSVGSTARHDPAGTLTYYELVLDDGDSAVERLVPSDEVRGWANTCRCGWTGTRYTRVTTEADAQRDDVVHLPLGGPGDLPDALEEEFHREWLRHLEPQRALDDITAAAAAVAAHQRLLTQAVHAARNHGLSWEKIGAAAGLTRQSAHERWSQKENP